MTAYPLALDSQQLAGICTSQFWCAKMQRMGPYKHYADFIKASDHAFEAMVAADWLEAFEGHPMIGDLDSLNKKYAQGKNLSQQEQQQVSAADPEVLLSLHQFNQAYFDKFGFIFIVFASDKTAAEMLRLIKARIDRSFDQELKTASEEQIKISKHRMEAFQ